MAEQDVQVKEVDVIRAYNKKFGDFLNSFSGHIHQLRQQLQEKREELQQMVRKIKKEKERVYEEKQEAYERMIEAYTQGAHRDDYSLHDEYEHLVSVYHSVQNCAELGHARLTRAEQIINEIDSRTRKIETEFQKYVQQGRLYLDKVELYIDQYKES